MRRKIFWVALFVFACFVASMFSQAAIPISTAQIVVTPGARNPVVNPDNGSYNDYFDYSIEVNYSEGIDIRFCIWNVTTHVFEPEGEEKRYTNFSHWQSLSWNNITFTPDFEGKTLSFRFEYRKGPSEEWKILKVKNKDAFPGPTILRPPPKVQFNNGSVHPGNVNCTEEVIYNVSVNASKEVEIELEVYDPISKDWVSQGERKSYKDIGIWTNMSWNVTPFEDLKFSGHLDSRYKFKAYYKGEHVNSSDIYPGPRVFGATFENPRLEPFEGNYHDNFTYHVEVSNVSEEDINRIHLEIWNPCNLTWEDMGSATTNTTENNRTWNLTWGIAPFKFNSKCEGMSKYRFRYGNSFWPEYPREGPHLSVDLINISKVEPKEIEYRVYDGYVTPVNINVNISTTKGFDLELFIFDPVKEVWNSKGVRHCSESGNWTWTVTPFEFIPRGDVKNYIGKKFNIRFGYDGKIKEYEGPNPELVVAFDNPKYPSEVVYGEHFNFSVDVIASRNLNITLKYRYKGNWTDEKGINNNPQNYTKGDWQPLVWNCTALYSWDAFKFVWWNESDPALNINVKMLSFSRALGKEGGSIITVKPKLEEVEMARERENWASDNGNITNGNGAWNCTAMEQWKDVRFKSYYSEGGDMK